MKLFATTALALLAAAPAFAQDDWRTDYAVIKVGILSSENEQDRLSRNEPMRAFLAQKLGVEVEIFTAGNYDGVIQAMAASQIEFGFYGSSSYAAVYTATEGKVIPLLTSRNADDSTGYYSVITVRCDSGITDLAGLEGKTLAFADPDSTSGYAVPLYNLVNVENIDPETYFSAIPFSGSHEAGVQGVVAGTFDAAATYQDSEINGIYQNMEDKGMIPEGEVCVIWESPEITSGPFTARAELPPTMIEDVTAALEAFPLEDTEGYAIYASVDEGDANPTVGYVRVDHDRYQWIVDMRAWLAQRRRG
ncbi:phosphate/phosphite/phosphonate ABC transporter substrate-binding protein [Yoonia vestfoldensis]|jgi:phosphonate transport system substrate-binding protein|uniref:phosphate/phosphite/phosphonate ABC transporter substrate-binding protein n=1 Tax=Yoonia vestfoldensis TaxID=245188 RepID=UPI00035DD5A3|nr:phosphate/phosphite/phosphonate ABC transporter substrate-binding protein [Yoonia vestfoldensis]